MPDLLGGHRGARPPAAAPDPYPCSSSSICAICAFQSGAEIGFRINTLELRTQQNLIILMQALSSGPSSVAAPPGREPSSPPPGCPPPPRREPSSPPPGRPPHPPLLFKPGYEQELSDVLPI
ncbi:hypothetical protein PVAP13_7NG045751 [Panicum virgatum]|uniref:Uncharacterized protein n=1 Tax=Panicum virgatum TaxID=38727 RepID=A0A8T0Q4T8_PANVG|nr:hypothetical protein PVAP13_7NG045751 [Panicum virgatum]